MHVGVIVSVVDCGTSVGGGTCAVVNGVGSGVGNGVGSAVGSRVGLSPSSAQGISGVSVGVGTGRESVTRIDGAAVGTSGIGNDGDGVDVSPPDDDDFGNWLSSSLGRFDCSSWYVCLKLVLVVEIGFIKPRLTNMNAIVRGSLVVLIIVTMIVHIKRITKDVVYFVNDRGLLLFLLWWFRC